MPTRLLGFYAAQRSDVGRMLDGRFRFTRGKLRNSRFTEKLEPAIGLEPMTC